MSTAVRVRQARGVRRRVHGAPGDEAEKEAHYYVCRAGRIDNFGEGRPHHPACANAGWLEGLVWSYVRCFLENSERSWSPFMSSSEAGRCG